MSMKRKDFFKSIGLCTLIPVMPKERLYTFNSLCELTSMLDGELCVYPDGSMEITKGKEVLYKFYRYKSKYFKEVRT